MLPSDGIRHGVGGWVDHEWSWLKVAVKRRVHVYLGFTYIRFMPPDLKGRPIPLLMKTALTCCNSGYKY